MKPHRLELADVFRPYQHDFLARWNSVLSRQQRKALRDIRDCRTAVLGPRGRVCEPLVMTAEERQKLEQSHSRTRISATGSYAVLTSRWARSAGSPDETCRIGCF